MCSGYIMKKLMAYQIYLNSYTLGNVIYAFYELKHSKDKLLLQFCGKLYYQC